MTPGAWEKQGLTYRLSQPTPPPPPVLIEEPYRRQKLVRLRDVLWSYARAHEKRFPANDSGTEIPSELWLASETPRGRYLYVAGQTVDQGASPLVYEPGTYGERRLVLLTDRTIKAMALEEILQMLPPEKP